MKKTINLSLLALFVFGLYSCGKPGTGTPSPTTTAKCKPLTESSNFNSTFITYTYSYNTDGTLAQISYPPIKMAVDYAGTSVTLPASFGGGLTDSLNTVYNGNIFTGFPTQASQSITSNGVTQRNYWVYNFSYDTKNRLIQVIQTTPNVPGDYEYKVSIIYNNDDNVTQLKYENYTGPDYLISVNATGYDDKPSPYTAIKNWQWFMHAAWNNYDPAPILAALSKNNPLGFNYTGTGVNASTITRTMVYTYNDNGFPIKRTNTNTNNAGTSSFDETYTYQCQ